MACSLKTFDTWPELKSFLKATFGEKKHSCHLLSDLQSCKQASSETVTQFSLRIESCLTRIQADIHYSCSDKTQLVGRVAAMEDLALHTFITGLNPNIATIVRCRNPTTLNDAITLAVEEEKMFNLNKISSRSYKTCQICSKQGHTSSECYQNRSRSRPPVHRSYHVPNPAAPLPFSGNRNVNNFRQVFNNSSNYNNKFCNYCKNKGHVINECRKRQFYNQVRSDNSQPDPATSFTQSAAASSSRGNANNTTRMHCCDTIFDENSHDNEIDNHDLNVN